MKNKAMKGLVSLNDVLAAMPEERRRDIEARGAELIAKVQRRMIHAELRKDPRLSALQRKVETLGGKLSIVVRFPNQEPIVAGDR